MKTIRISLFLYAIALALSSCGVNSSLSLSHTGNNTQVNLSSNNYRVVGRVTGSAKVPYVLFVGGIKRKQLFENAYSDMLKKAELEKGARAIANVVREEHMGGVYPIYFKRTITISGNVIEFEK